MKLTWLDVTLKLLIGIILCSPVLLTGIETLFLGALRYGSIRGNGFSFTVWLCCSNLCPLFGRERKTSPTLCCYSEENASPSPHLLLEWLTFWHKAPSGQSMNDFGGDWHRKNVCDGNEILFEMTLFSWWECRIQNTNKLTSSDLCVIFASVSIFTGSLIAHSIWCLLYYWRTWIYLWKTGCNICILYLYSS